MKAPGKYSCEVYAFLLTVVFFTDALYLVVADSVPMLLSAVLSLLLIADAVALFFTLRKLWRTKWKKALTASVQKLFAKVARRLMRILEKWNIAKGGKSTVITGKTHVSFDFASSVSREQKTKKLPKWKQLESNRERLGFLYRQITEKRIKHGVSVYASDTPSEVKLKSENKDFENEIYDLYIVNRYKETVQIDTKTLNNLKDELNK